MADALISIMEILNPPAKEQVDYKQKFWDHLHMIAGFNLDVDSPYPIPVVDDIVKKPKPIPYSSQPIKFRFYGRNLQYMVNKAATIGNPEMKNEFLNLLASFMSNSSRNWNNENLTNTQLAEHLKMMSSNKLEVNPEDLEITLEQRRKKFFKPNNSNNNNSNKFFNKNKKHNNYKK